MRIFANHAHIIPAEFRENCGIDGLREVMADCGIEKAVCFAPLPYQMVNCQNRDSCRFCMSRWRATRRWSALARWILSGRI